MSMTLSGNGTITGLVSGGLPDGTVLPADLSTGGPYWDAYGNLTTVGNGKFGPGGTTSNAVLFLEGSNASGKGAQIQFRRNGSATAQVGHVSEISGGTSNDLLYYCGSGVGQQWYTNGSEHMRLDSSGNLKFNSGYGSVATAYGCRAWVNFNGTGTVAIRGSGNVSSITDNGTGDYTVNFTTAMPDVNYSAVISQGNDNTGNSGVRGANILATQVAPTTSAVRVGTWASTGTRFPEDSAYVFTAIFR